MNIRRKLLEAAYPITYWIGKAHLPFTHKAMTSADYRQIAAHAEPGRVLLSRVKGEVSNLFIPGYWTHAAIIDHGCQHVIEATYAGVVKTDLIDFVMGKDAVAMAYYKSLTPNNAGAAVLRAQKYVGLEYDFFFEAGVKAFYCAELIYAAYQLDGGRRDVFGEIVYTPDMIYEDMDTWGRVGDWD